MEFIKRDLGEFHKFHMKWPQMYDSVYHMGFCRLKSWNYFNSKHDVVTVGIMSLRANN